MSPRLVAALLALCVIGWWYSPVSPRVPRPPPLAAGAVPRCPPPPRVARGAEPLQSELPPDLPAFELEAATLQPLAGFSLDARVLGREDYAMDAESSLSPTDLALGWQAMTDPAVLSRLHIAQSARWYSYRWEGEPPLPPEQIHRSAANMHMIPFDNRVARALRKVRKGDRVRIDGWLVEAATPQGRRWRSSLTRTDAGAGACELIYVCAIEIEGRY